MTSEQLKFLCELLEAPSVSGFEQPVQKVWREYVSKIASEHTDQHGNCIAIINKNRSPRILLTAHCDEIGFIVKYINEDGFIHFATVGGFDPQTLPGDRVVIQGKKGPIHGTIGRKPVHLMQGEEREKQSPIKDMWIDIGAANKEEAQEVVAIGNPITRSAGLQHLQKDRIMSHALDDKIGLFIIARTLEELAAAGPEAAIYAVSAVGEEIGSRGARTSTFAIDPQIGIAVDVTVATDHPHTNKAEHGDIRLNAGPAICVGANINPRLSDLLIDTATRNSIPYQIEIAGGATWTDADVIQLSRSGVATALVSLPTRYLHTASEICATSDVDLIITLLAKTIAVLTSTTNLIP